MLRHYTYVYRRVPFNAATYAEAVNALAYGIMFDGLPASTPLYRQA